ncbi:FtsX-like permease family protein [Wukongibacter sp. M2B1]|uniref:ABC transporter permease n=1 Tax=Wukongibacter sp. M2B1 TaxID=3088895 RepID=UPI003D78C745
MRQLNRMLIRDIKKSKGQVIAAATVICIGITLFLASYMSYYNFSGSVNSYYREYNLLDYYAEVIKIPVQSLDNIKKIKGVKKVEPRISEDVICDMNNNKRVKLKLISLPDKHLPSINKPYFLEGSYFKSSKKNLCMIDQKFAKFHNLKIGENVKVIIKNKLYEFKIDSIVTSPEFVYAMKSTSTFTKPGEEFGILYIKESTASELMGYFNSYNQIHIVFDKDANTKEIINNIENYLKPYGFIKGIEKKDQMSYKMVAQELSTLQSTAPFYPIIFFSVASMIIYILMKRIIANQRTLIGVMKALGYNNLRIIWHYILYSQIIAVIGIVPSIFMGYFLSVKMTNMYNKTYTIPVLQTDMNWGTVGIAVIICITFSLLAGYNASKKALKIQAAEAMRREVPSLGKKIILENFKILWNNISFGWKMSIRNICRNYQRTTITLLGVSFTIMFIIMSIFLADSLDYVLKQHFFDFQTYDYKVVFSEPVNYYDALNLKVIDEIKYVKPIVEIPVYIKKGWREKETVIVGLGDENPFYNFIDSNRDKVSLPRNGLLIADGIAENLALKSGDSVTVKSFLKDVKEKDVRVAGIVKQYSGSSCYMNLRELSGVLGEGKFATAALIYSQNNSGDSLRKKLYNMRNIEAIESRLTSYEALMEYMGTMYAFIVIIVLGGVIMGFSIIFNTTVINIMERRRELASLKVIGYTEKEIERIIFRENMVIATISLIPGFIMGKMMCYILGTRFKSDLFSLEVVIYNRTYLLTFLSVLLFVVVAQLANRKKIYSLDMIEVLKNREG